MAKILAESDYKSEIDVAIGAVVDSCIQEKEINKSKTETSVEKPMKINHKLAHVFIVITAILFINCSSSNSTDVKVKIDFGSSNRQAVVQHDLFDKFLCFFAAKAHAAVPLNIVTIGVKVSGTNMATIEQTFSADVSTIILTVPSGIKRFFTIEAKDLAGDIILIGNSDAVKLIAGEVVTLTISMEPVSWGTIYVANAGSNNVSVINGETNTVSITVTVGAGPFGVTVNEATKRVYVTNNSANTVSVINGETNTIIGGAIAVGDSPRGLDANPNTNKIYVATEYESGDVVTVIDGSDNSISTIALGNCYPYDGEINLTTNKAYFSVWGSSDFTVINMATDTESSFVPLTGGDPYGVGVNEYTNKIYISENANNIVEVINGSTDTVIGSISVGDEPYGVGVNKNTNRIYVANFIDGTVSVIDGSTDTVITTITVGTNPMGVEVNSDSNRIYVTNYGSATVSVIRGSTNEVFATISVGINPSYLDIMK